MKSVRLFAVSFLVMTTLVVAVPALAQTPAVSGSWARVMELERGKEIQVATRGSIPVSRVFLEATEAELTVRDGSAVQRLPRTLVSEVYVRSTNVRRILGTILGAATGFFTGGMLGGMLENTFAPCNCDDPGLRGVLVGMPAGAVVGGIVGNRIAPDRAYKVIYRN